MTVSPLPTGSCPDLTSFVGDTGRFHVCPTTGGLHVTIQRYDGPPHSMLLDREQALALLHVLQRSYPEQG
ncbi:hypothetical protein [Deinococcus hopiensis]|uniref:Uncharacterized protein n=1 Tax=Deinococcus hopiensis KR-140 TaxID=695939 RepID=A0A1W1UQG0_9DEIO|nr:hypothetical protein [Deinococcus hopiensis]SMB83337.1 hypothetical protein SAMN00790413_04368 [Deinococcus hopiensis KR-140]